LNNSLLSELYKVLVATLTSNTYQEYCFLLYTVNYNLEAIKNCKLQGSRLLYTIIQTKDIENKERIDWEPTCTTGIAAAQQQRTTWILQEVIEKRRKDRTCLCCRSNYFVQEYSFLPAVRPNSQTLSKPNSTAVATAKVEEIAEEDKSEKE
jgi:hypothetical protein